MGGSLGVGTVTLVGYEHAHCGGQACGTLVQVHGHVIAFEGGDAAQLHFLANLGGQFQDGFAGGLAINLNGSQLFRGVGLGCCGGVGNFLGEFNEFGALSHEVGFGVDLNQGGAGHGNQTF